MPVITEDTIRDLAAFKSEGVPVTSCYLDVDGRRLRSHSDVEHELDVLLRNARTSANGTASVHDDLARIESFVRGGFDRSNTRGLAIFSCSAQDLWKVIPLPVPVRSRVIINNVPAVGQLESVVQEYDRFGVLLVDRQRMRMFVFEMGELIDRSEQAAELARDYDTRGEKEWGDVTHHVDARPSNTSGGPPTSRSRCSASTTSSTSASALPTRSPASSKGCSTRTCATGCAAASWCCPPRRSTTSAGPR